MRYPGFRIAPTWKGNLLIFGLLIIIVLFYFFWQIRYAEQTFTEHVQEHTRMLAGVISLNAGSAVLSKEVTEEIMETFLGNSARFVDYLDTIEPFSESELTAFAMETGLTGICIVRKNGDDVQGPGGWFSVQDDTCGAKNHSLRHLKDSSLYYLSLPRAESGCVVVGLTSARIEKLQEQVSLPYLLETLTGLAGIRYVRIEKGSSDHKNRITRPQVTIIGDNADRLAEARVSIGNDILLVGLEARLFFVRIKHLRNEFFVFSVIIALLGIFFSWFLYRYQNAYLEQVRTFERRLAREQEDATLGRASATITHEIRNPLNAISMGLQRLQIEADELTGEHQELVSTILKAVHRTNGIITDLRRYVGPFTPRGQVISPDSVINGILALYSKQCNDCSIAIIYKADYTGTVTGDNDLLEVVIGNLIKNAVEAQPDGGFLKIRTFRQGIYLVLSFENSGADLTDEDAERILEPYFTTKTRGSGLGLAIVRRIVHAHGGRLEILVPAPGLLRIVIYLPLKVQADRPPDRPPRF